jgi:serine/threonine-protein kinase
MPEIPKNLQASLGSSYRIVRDLGGGGMSHVYLAHDESLGRDIVVKVLHGDLVDVVNLERFSREIKLAARLSHPHIVPLLTAGESDGRPFYTMPLVKGQSLRDRLDAEGALRAPDAIRILRDVAAALGYAHDQGVVHRDIKPDNILLTGDSAAVTDFGVAKALSASSPTQTAVTSVGISLGTPAYMAPEQAAGDTRIDGRADLYALGVTAFEMVGGRVPFHDRTVQAMLAAHISEPPPDIRTLRADLPARLSALIMQCLAKDPNQRPHDAADFIRTLDSLSDPTLQTVAHPSLARPLLAKPSSTGVQLRVAAILGMGVLAVAAIGYFANRRASARDAELASSAPSAVSAAPLVSIAVLPFGGGTDTSDTYLREGMAEQLMGAIGRVPGVRVASRISTFAFEGRTDVSTADIGKQLNVLNVLEGTVRRQGERLRVFVQLTDVQNGSALWSESFDFARADVFAVQDSISRTVLNRLRINMATAESAGRHRGTRDLAAYDFYLRARYQFNKFDEAPLRESIALYDQALQRDPQYADAWAGIAASWLFLADDYVAPRIAYPAVRRAAEQALSLDSTIAEAHAALGSALFSYDWDFAGGRREIARAVQIDPRSFLVLIAQQALYVALGKPDSAQMVLQRGQAADPLSPLNALLAGRFFAIVGRYDDAIAQYQRVVELAPPLAPFALIPMAEAQIATGKTTLGDSTLAQVKAMLPPPFHFLFASAEAALGHEKNAREMLKQYEAVAQKQYVRPELIATVYARLGDNDAAFAWLEKAYAAHSPYLFALSVDKQWDSLRSDPRFAGLEARLAAITKAGR